MGKYLDNTREMKKLWIHERNIDSKCKWNALGIVPKTSAKETGVRGNQMLYTDPRPSRQ